MYKGKKLNVRANPSRSIFRSTKSKDKKNCQTFDLEFITQSNFFFFFK